jgi:hypothetical protein
MGALPGMNVGISGLWIMKNNKAKARKTKGKFKKVNALEGGYEIVL